MTIIHGDSDKEDNLTFVKFLSLSENNRKIGLEGRVTDRVHPDFFITINKLK